MKMDIGSRIGEPQARRSIPLTGRLLFGAVILVLGLLWTAENLGFGEVEAVLRWWPVLLLGYGLVRVLGLDGSRSVVSGTLFILAGGWMVARELGWVHLSIWRLWPVWMIVVGAGLIFRSLRPEQPQAGSSVDSFPRPFAIMGGVTRSIESQDLTGIEATAVMGGVELDLRGAKARDREVVLEVFTMMGGIDLVVPEDWRVVTEATPIMGGIEDKTHAPLDSAATTLIVRGFVVMGGVELKNKRRESSRQDSRQA
jgi:predicted membrane protein